jgi:hypothetical protein
LDKTGAIVLSRPGLFSVLFALSPLVPRAGKKLAVLVFSHLLSSLFDDTAQWITPFGSNSFS